MSQWSVETFVDVVNSLGETFNDFVLALRELVKTCNFCSNNCTCKNIRNQIIEGILDGDTVEDLLQEKDLTLDRAIQVCQAQEAAKRQRASMSSGYHDSVAALKKPTAIPQEATQPWQPPVTHQPVQDVVTSLTLEVVHGALPLACLVTFAANWVILLRYAVANCHNQIPHQHQLVPMPCHSFPPFVT